MKKIKFLLLFFWIPFWLSAQNISVSDRVTDQSGEALICVSVVEQGTTNGAATDFNGQYSLTVASNALDMTEAEKQTYQNPGYTN